MLENRGRLPHFQRDGVLLFLTWRLWGSLPRPVEATTETGYPTPSHAFPARDRALDRDTAGLRWLQDPRPAVDLGRAADRVQVDGAGFLIRASPAPAERKA